MRGPLGAATAGNGSISVVSATALTINLAAAESAKLTPKKYYFFDIKLVTASATTTIVDGKLNLKPDISMEIV